MLVLGAGPAGTAVAGALASRGLTVSQVDPHPDRGWPNRYGAWVDELRDLALDHVAHTAWPRCELVVPDGGVIHIERGYASVDGARLRDALRDRGVVRRLSGSVAALEHHAGGTTALLTTGSSHRARLIVDATGHQSPFVRRTGPPARAWQIAYGAEHLVQEAPYAPGAMRFMDWRPASEPDGDARPSFLYAMPLGEGRWFFEETLLIGDPPMGMARLQERLARRLEGDGVKSRPLEGEACVEHCRIPMDPPMPALDQRVVGFGAAASFVHPATGYLLTRTLRAAGPLADAVEQGISAGHEPARVAREAWAAIWPSTLVEAAELLRFGARALLGMDRAALGAFYRAFFSIDESAWRGYLTGDLPAGELARVMLAVFGASGAGIRWRLARHGLREPTSLLRGLRRLAG